MAWEDNLGTLATERREIRVVEGYMWPFKEVFHSWLGIKIIYLSSQYAVPIDPPKQTFNQYLV